jgi:cytoskeletal protein CcmA (bactofilin family)
MTERRLLDRFELHSLADDVTVVGPDLFLEGEIESPGSVVVAGRVDGPITSGGLVRVLMGAAVKGPIQAKAALVEGAVDGDLAVEEQFELAATGRVRGDVSGPRVAVAEGAYLKGKVRASTGGVTRFREKRT